MEGVRGDDSSPAIDRYRIGMRAVDEIRQQEYDKLCSEGRWTSPFSFITEERLRRSEWGSFTAQQIYIRDFLVSRGFDERRATERARAKLAYVYRSGEVRLCTHPGDLEEMTESDDEDLRAQSTPGFYDHSSRLNWRHSLVELPRHQKEREMFKAVIEMRKFCFVLIDERTKAELDYFQALPAQARHSIAQTKPAAWHVFEEAPDSNVSPTSSSTISACDLESTIVSACDQASTMASCDQDSTMSACDQASTMTPCDQASTISACDLPSTMSAFDLKSTISACNQASTMSAPDQASTMSACDLKSTILSACDLADDEESTGERTLPSPRPSLGYESSATDEDSDGQEGSRPPPFSTFARCPSRNNVTTTTPCALSRPNCSEGGEEAPFTDSVDESDSPRQDGRSANSSVSQKGFISSAGCSRRRLMSSKRLGRCADGTIQVGTSGRGGGGGGGGGGSGEDGSVCGAVSQEVSRETGSSDSCGGSVGISGGESVGIVGGESVGISGGGSVGIGGGRFVGIGSGGSVGIGDGISGGKKGERATSGDIRRRGTPAAITSRAIGRVGERAVTSSVTDGSGSIGFSGGCGSEDNRPNPPKGRFRQKACPPSTSTWAGQKRDYNVPNALPAHQGRSSSASKVMSAGARISHKDEKSAFGVPRSRPLTSTYLLSTTTSDSDGHGSIVGSDGGGGGDSCAAVGEPVARKVRSCRSSVETIPTGRGRCIPTRRSVISQSQAKKTALWSDSSSSAGAGAAGSSTSARRTSVKSDRSGRRRNSSDGKIGVRSNRSGRSRNGEINKNSSRKKASALTVIPLKSDCTGPSDCPAASRKKASSMTALSLKRGSKGPSGCLAEAAVGHAGGDDGGARGCTASVGTGMTDALIMDDVFVTKSRTAESVVPPNTSAAMNDSACSSGGSQTGDHGGVKLRPGLPFSGALADTGNGVRTGLTPADRYLVFGASASADDDDDDRREEWHTQEEDKDNEGKAKRLCNPCGNGGVLPTTATSGSSVPKAQPGTRRADQAAIISGQQLLLRQEKKLSVQDLSREPKRVGATNTEAELLPQDSRESLLQESAFLRQDSSRESLLLPPHRKSLPEEASKSRATVRAARHTAAKIEAEVRQDSRESLLPSCSVALPKEASKTQEATVRVARPSAAKTKAEVRQDNSRESLLLLLRSPRLETPPRTTSEQQPRAKTRRKMVRYAAAKIAAEKVLKDAMETIEIHNINNNNALVKLARHQCAKVEAKTAEIEHANTLLHNRLAKVQVRAAAAARDHLPATEDSQLFGTRVGEVDVEATSSTVTNDRQHRGFFHDDDVESRQQVYRPGCMFHVGKSAEIEPYGVRRLSEQEKTAAVAAAAASAAAAVPAVQHSCISAMFASSTRNGRDVAEPAAGTVTTDAKTTAERAKVTSAESAAVLPRHAAEKNTAVARPTARVAHQESYYGRTNEARTVLENSLFQETEAKEKKDAMMVVASDCRNTHLVYLKRKQAFEEKAWKVADAGMRSARASIAAEFASVQLHLHRQHAVQLAKEARATAKTTDEMGKLARRVSMLEQWKDDRLKIEEEDNALEEDCRAVETACRIAALRSRNNVRTAARLESFEKVAAKNNGCEEGRPL